MYLTSNLFVVLLLICAQYVPVISPDSAGSKIVVDNFEDDHSGSVPSKWRYLDFRQKEFLPLEGTMNDQQHFFVMAEGENHFVRAYTHGEAHRITIPASTFGWDLRTRPYLQWKWRAGHLPAKAREDRLNDSGGAVYVTFDKRDWLGRPYSIKYVYSTTLPVGTVVSTGNVKVIVASSGRDGIGAWKLVTRDVTADYRKVFDEDVPDRPFSITLWSDSDNTGDVAQVDFDDILVK